MKTAMSKRVSVVINKLRDSEPITSGDVCYLLEEIERQKHAKELFELAWRTEKRQRKLFENRLRKLGKPL